MKKINLPLETFVKISTGKKNTNPSVKQTEQQARFKLISQFTALWIPVLLLFLAKKVSRSKARNYASGVAADVCHTDNHVAIIKLDEFENAINFKSRQFASPDVILTFTATTQSIVAPDGDVVNGQIVAFDENSNPIGCNTFTYVSNGSPKSVELPAIKGDATRYDIMIFNTSFDDVSSYNGPIGDISGKDVHEILSAQDYSLLVNAAENSIGTIKGIQTGSFLVTP